MASVLQYLKDSIDQIISFFKSNTTVTQNLALETAAAVQVFIIEFIIEIVVDEVRF